MRSLIMAPIAHRCSARSFDAPRIYAPPLRISASLASRARRAAAHARARATVAMRRRRRAGMRKKTSRRHVAQKRARASETVRRSERATVSRANVRATLSEISPVACRSRRMGMRRESKRMCHLSSRSRCWSSRAYICSEGSTAAARLSRCNASSHRPAPAAVVCFV
jgi:hypothetical protein